jgi:NitT/TauT family transport system ATP-binding protein
VLFVTHSIAEAVFLSDRIVVLTPRPGSINDIVGVPFPRPRDHNIRRSPEFRDIVECVESKIL